MARILLSTYSCAVIELIFTKPKRVYNMYLKSHIVVNPHPCMLCDVVFFSLLGRHS